MSNARKAMTRYEKPKLLPLDRWDAEASGSGYGPQPFCTTAGILDNIIIDCLLGGSQFLPSLCTTAGIFQ